MSSNISPATFTGLGVLVGYLLIGELTPMEQAAVGSWLNLVGDVLATNAGWIGVMEEKAASNSEATKDVKEDKKDSKSTDTDVIYKAISKMKKDIENLQQKNKKMQ